MTPPTVVIRVAGDLDIATAPAVRGSVVAALRLRLPVVLDLAGVTFLDASALRVMVEGHRLAGRLGTGFALRRPSGTVRRLLAATGLDCLFAVETARCPGVDRGRSPVRAACPGRDGAS